MSSGTSDAGRAPGAFWYTGRSPKDCQPYCRDEQGPIYAFVRGAGGQQRFRRFPSGTSPGRGSPLGPGYPCRSAHDQPARGTLATDVDPFSPSVFTSATVGAGAAPTTHLVGHAVRSRVAP